MTETAQNITPIEIAHALPTVGLTPDDLVTLRKPFAPNEHEFLRGFTYITEEAISNRLDEVDPSWSLVIINQTVRDNQAVVTVRLTVKGVGRDGVGMQTINDKAGEAEKGAATDALKRASRLFGIGRYILGIPDNVKDMAALTKWLGVKPAAPAPTNGKDTPPDFTAADIEAALKDASLAWDAYKIEPNTAGHARVAVKDKAHKPAAIEAIAGRGMKVIDNAVKANWFDVMVLVVGQPH